MPHSSVISRCLAASAISAAVAIAPKFVAAEEGQSIPSRLVFERLPDLPNALGVAGPFVGVHGDVLIVAGGANFPTQPYWENPKVWHDDVWVLRKGVDGELAWRAAPDLAAPIAYGAVAQTSRGLVCVGGDNGQATTDKCFLLAWDPDDESVVVRPLPSLPAPFANGAATAVGDAVYVACGQSGAELSSANDQFWRLDLSQEAAGWQTLPSCPGGARAFNMAAAQHNGFETCVYVFGGRRVKDNGDLAGGIVALNDLWEFTPDKGARGRWRRRADLPHPLMAGSAAAVGQSHVYALTGADGSLWDESPTLRLDHPGFPRRSLAYHTITDTWIEAGETPANPVTTPAVPWGDRIIIASGESQPGLRSAAVWSARPVPPDLRFGTANTTVLIAYLLGLIAVGVHFSRRNTSTEDYFRGGQRVAWWAAGCSIFATMLSSITFMAIPAKAYAQDLVYLTGSLTILIAAPAAIYLAMPFFRRIDATSAYEYLEKRFDRRVRWFASLSFTLFHICRMGIVLSLAALTLAVTTPLSPVQCVLIMGGLSIAYSTLGGVEAVIWTDTLQTFVLLGGALTCLSILLRHADGSPGELFAAADAAGKLRLANLGWDPTNASLVLWVVLLGGIGQNLSSYTADQAVVQRYMTTPDKRRAASSIWLAAILAIPASLIFYAMGTALYLFYRAHPEKLEPTFNTDQILPLFIATELPIGVGGLLVAAVFAAAQSTISTSMNSTATAFVTDFLRPLRCLRSERGYLNAARLLTLAFGLLGTGIGLLFVSPEVRSLFDQFIRVVGLFMGVLGGLFALGMLTRRATGTGSLIGATAGALLVGLMPYCSEISGFLYATIGIAVCFVVGYASSLCFGAPARETGDLTAAAVLWGAREESTDQR